MKYLIVLIFISVYSFCGLELGFSASSPVWTHFTYIFQHAGMMHLIINSLAFISVYRSVQSLGNTRPALPLAFLIACGISFVTVRELPTVGASGLVYALLGIYTGLTLCREDIRIISRNRYLVFLFCILLGLTISYFKHNSNFLLHAGCYGCGCLTGCLLSIPPIDRFIYKKFN